VPPLRDSGQETGCTYPRHELPSSHSSNDLKKKVVDDYNHHTNVVDLADQRHATYTTHQHTQCNWLCLFHLLLDVSVVNSHLCGLTPHEALLTSIDMKQPLD